MVKRLLFIFCLFPILAIAQEPGSVTGLPIPRFITLKSNEVNLRKGPNSKYPISWTYQRKGYPMQLIAEFENWRKIKDVDNVEGWVHENLITGARSVLVIDNQYQRENPEYQKRKKELVIFPYPDETSYPMLRVEFGVLAKLKKCTVDWCKVRIEDLSGWVRKENLWGVFEEEIID